MVLVTDEPEAVGSSLAVFGVDPAVTRLVVSSASGEALDLVVGAFQSDPDAELPSVVLVDLAEPLTRGIEIVRRLRADERTSSVPVVIRGPGADRSVDEARFSSAVRDLGRCWVVLDHETVPGRS